METLSSLGETKHTILILLLDGESTGEGLAQRLGMNLSVVRRHLDDMAANKLVGSSFRREGRGRPRKYYSIAAEGRNRISAKYDLVADLLTMAIAKDMGPGKARDLFGSAARVLATGTGKQENANSLLPVLNDFGFQPQLRKEGKKELIISRNCPILKLAQKYPELTCDTFHTIFLREVLNRPRVTLRQAIARGATECIHEAQNNPSGIKIIGGGKDARNQTGRWGQERFAVVEAIERRISITCPGKVVSTLPYFSRPARDPVCGMIVDEKLAKFQIGYAGRIHYFCSSRCLESFTANPAKYTK